MHMGLAPRTVWLILPAYNEATNLQPLLDRVRTTMAKGVSFQVLVIDDGSSDDIASVVGAAAENLPINIVKHKQNLGLAAAVRTGMREVCLRATNGDVVVTMDADNSHSPELVPEMLRKLDSGCDIVIASRFVRGGNQKGFPLKRRALSRTASLIFQILWPIRGVRDYTTGFRAYQARMLKELWAIYAERLVEGTGFSVQTEILLKARARCPVVAEVPQLYRYDLKKGRSKMRLIKTLLDYARLFRRECRLGKPGYPTSSENDMM